MSAPPPRPDPRIGMILDGRYRIDRKIGQGGMGVVYQGEHVKIRRKVAVKCLHAAFAEDAGIIARFHREALAATQIGHPNIVEVTDMGQLDDGSAYMILEYLEGRDLRKVLSDEGKLSVGRASNIAAQICNALTAAHAKGIVHRDLKPENIFLISRGEELDFVKVLDFGISKFQNNLIVDSTGSPNTLTGTTLGSPHYMSPEQLNGSPSVDHRTDIYALGVVMYRALTGEYPFHDASFPQMVIKILHHPVPPLRTKRSDVPEALAELIDKMLSKKADDRPSDCASVKAALKPFRSASSFEISSSIAIGAGPTSQIVLSQQAPASPPLEPTANPVNDVAAAVVEEHTSPRRSTPPSGPLLAAPASGFSGELGASTDRRRVAMLGLGLALVAIAVALGVFVAARDHGSPRALPLSTPAEPSAAAPPIHHEARAEREGPPAPAVEAPAEAVEAPAEAVAPPAPEAAAVAGVANAAKPAEAVAEPTEAGDPRAPKAGPASKPTMKERSRSSSGSGRSIGGRAKPEPAAKPAEPNPAERRPAETKPADPRPSEPALESNPYLR